MSKEYEIAFQLVSQLSPQFKTAFNQSTRQVEELQKQLKLIERSIGPRKSMLDTIKTGDAFGNARKHAEGFMNILGRVAQYTGAYAMVSGIVDGFKNVVGLVGDYEGGMKQLQASTNLTAKQMVGIEVQSSSLYRDNIGQNWDDLTDSLATVRQVTGLANDALKVTTRDAIVFRDVFGEDVTQSIRAADQMARQFGISQHEGFNLMAQGMKGGLNMSDELLDSISEYSVYFQKLGYDANSMFDVFGAGATSGVFQLDKIGDAIKELTIRTKDQSKSSAEGYEALGLNAEQFEQALARGGDTAKLATQKIFQALAKVQDPVKRNAAGVALMGTQFEDLEYEATKAMGEARSQFDMTRETMKNVQNVKFDTLGMAFQAIGRSVEMDFIQPLSAKLLPILTKVAKWFTSTDGKAWMKNMQDSIQGIIKKAFELYNTVRNNWTGIKNIAFSVVAGIVAMQTAFGALKIIGSINALMNAYRAGTLLASAAQWALNGAMLANPIGIVIVSIGALVAAIVLAVKYWDAIKAAVGRFWEAVKSWLGGIGAWFSERWTEAYNAATTAFGGLTSWFGGIFEGIKGIFSGAVNWIIEKLNWVIEKANGISFDIPDFLGGGTIGVDIPKIPTVGGYAEGGHITKPELAWLGEGGDDEFVVPNNNKPRSHAILGAANKAMGYGSAGGSTSETTASYVYSPKIIIQGNANPDDVASVLQNSQAEFARNMKQWQRNNTRVSLSQ